MSEYPECEKMSAVQDESQCIGQFLEWLQEQQIDLCTFGDGHTYFADRRSTEQLLADYFGIDLNKVEQERQAMLSGIRAHNNTKDFIKDSQ